MLYINDWMKNGCWDVLNGMSWAQGIIFQGIVKRQSNICSEDLNRKETQK